MRRFFTGVAFLLLVNGLFIPHSVRAISSSIVISQVYGGGGNSGATLRNDFIELFNRGNATISLTGWSVQYASTAGTTWQVTPLTGSLAPGAHYLIQEAQGTGGTTNLPTPDATGTIPMAAGAGKVALLSSAAAIPSGTSCPSGVVDFVGYGTGTNCFEGAAPTPTLSNTTAALRGFAGCTETDNNAADFATGTPTPRNTASPATSCDNPTTPLAIHDIQGSSSTSPHVGVFVRAEGVVTAIRFNNGFFVQSPDDETDADPNTSEGIFVFTSSVPPAAAAVGNRVRVTGTVAEFLADAGSLTATEIISPAVVVLSTGNTLPSAIALSSADTNPAGPLDQLERYEGMRVHVETLNVVAPTQGSVNEVTAIGSTNGVYYGVIPNVARPFRQPGIEVPTPLPPGSPCCVTRFDGNPERIRVDSNGNAAFSANQTTEVMTGATVSGITGVLDYSTHAYTILPDFGAQGVVAQMHGYSAVSPIAAHRFTIATANLERFFDTVDTAGISDIAVSATGYQRRLTKVGLQICDVMRAPDIIGVEEVENVTVLQDIAAAANSNASCNGTNYAAYLFEGNDPGGIDDGFLVNLNRVVVRDVHQEGKDTTFIDPTDGSVDVLNDRPPTVLAATITSPGDPPQNITVIANHLRSLNDIDADGPGGAGPRVRAKRLAQAEFLGTLIENLQLANGAEPVVAVGDFNAFEFSDGYVDVIGTIKGTPVPANQVVLASQQVPNASAPLVDLIDTDQTAQRYSYSFDGNAQSLDHVLGTQAAFGIFDHIEWGHSNADFPETLRGDATRPERLSDHDPVVAYFVLAAETTTTVSASPNPAAFAQDMTFTATVGTPAPVTSGAVQFSDGAGYSASVAVVGGQASVVVPASSFGVGTHTMSAAYTDGVNFAPSSGSTSFTVVDVVPPVISGLVDLVVEANGPSGSVVAFSPTATDDVDGAVAVSCTPPTGTTFPLGTTTVTCTAEDRAGNVATGSFTVTVRDTTAPSVPVLSASPNVLGPVNHKMIAVQVTALSTDTASAVVCGISSIASNESDNGLDDGDTSGDIGPIVGLGTTLRAERSGTGQGRIYSLTVVCRDAAGNSSSAVVPVIVPKGQ